MRRSPLVRLAPILLAPVLLAGCGSTDPGSAAAPSESPAAGGPTRYATLPELTAALSAQSELDGTSAYEFTTAGAQTATGSGVTRVDDAGQASRTRTLADAGDGQLVDIEVVVLDQELFIELPPEAGFEPDKPWVRVTPGGTDWMSRAVGPVAEQLRVSSSPVEQLKATEAAYTLTGVTEEQRAGEIVLRYAVDIDLDVLSDLTQQGGAEPLPVPPGQTSASYLVDVDDRLLESVSTVTVEGQTAVTTTTFSGWGEPVDITAPPAELIAAVE